MGVGRTELLGPRDRVLTGIQIVADLVGGGNSRDIKRSQDSGYPELLGYLTGSATAAGCVAVDDLQSWSEG